MKDIIIYGISQQAQQLKYFIESEQSVKVHGFVVDEEFYKGDNLLGLKVTKFSKILEKFSPNEFEIVLSFGYKNMVRNRQEKYELCKSLGYRIFSYISEDAKVYTDDIGEGTIIYPNVTIAPFTKIGKGNFFEMSSTIAHHTKIGDFNFFAPGATVAGNVSIGNNCFFGTSSIIFNNLDISDLTLVGAGAVISNNTLLEEAYVNNKSILINKKSYEVL